MSFTATIDMVWSDHDGFFSLEKNKIGDGRYVDREREKEMGLATENIDGVRVLERALEEVRLSVTKNVNQVGSDFS